MTPTPARQKGPEHCTPSVQGWATSSDSLVALGERHFLPKGSHFVWLGVVRMAPPQLERQRTGPEGRKEALGHVLPLGGGLGEGRWCS